MYDTKTRELRWNATYSDYSAPLYEESYPYSECHQPCPHWLCHGAAAAETWAAMAAGECGCCAMLCCVVLGFTCLAEMEPWLWDRETCVSLAKTVPSAHCCALQDTCGAAGCIRSPKSTVLDTGRGMQPHRQHLYIASPSVSIQKCLTLPPAGMGWW